MHKLLCDSASHWIWWLTSTDQQTVLAMAMIAHLIFLISLLSWLSAKWLDAYALWSVDKILPSLQKILWMPYIRHAINATVVLPQVLSLIQRWQLHFLGHVAWTDSKQDQHRSLVHWVLLWPPCEDLQGAHNNQQTVGSTVMYNCQRTESWGRLMITDMATATIHHEACY